MTADDRAPDAPGEGDAPELLCSQALQLAATALGTDADHAVMIGRALGLPDLASDLASADYRATRAQAEPVRTHPNPESVPWPDPIGCPFRPFGMRGPWYVFEERYPAPGHARRQVYLSDRQIRFGEIIAPLNLREDWLAEQFPVPGGDFEEWDIVAVVRWIRHHTAEAPNRRRDHARREDAPAAVQAQAPQRPAPQQEAPRTWAMRFDPASQTHAIAAVRTVTVSRDDNNWKRLVALTISVPGMRDLISVGVKLPEQAAQELADVLAGVVRAKP